MDCFNTMGQQLNTKSSSISSLRSSNFLNPCFYLATLCKLKSVTGCALNKYKCKYIKFVSHRLKRSIIWVTSSRFRSDFRSKSPVRQWDKQWFPPVASIRESFFQMMWTPAVVTSARNRWLDSYCPCCSLSNAPRPCWKIIQIWEILKWGHLEWSFMKLIEQFLSLFVKCEFMIL